MMRKNGGPAFIDKSNIAGSPLKVLTQALRVPSLL